MYIWMPIIKNYMSYIIDIFFIITWINLNLLYNVTSFLKNDSYNVKQRAGSHKISVITKVFFSHQKNINWISVHIKVNYIDLIVNCSQYYLFQINSVLQKWERGKRMFRDIHPSSCSKIESECVYKCILEKNSIISCF